MRRWLIAACGATLVIGVPVPVDAADSVTGIEVKAERRGGFRPSLFPTRTPETRSPFIVSPREAWESGAHAWTSSRRAKFANDPAVRATAIGLTGAANSQRADRDPAQWLPAPSLRCRYVSGWIAVKVAWGLSADAAENARLRRLVASCGSTATTAPGVVSVTTLPASGTAPKTTTPAGAGGGAAATSVLAELAKIKVAPEYTAGYDRDLFPHWEDLDGDGCDTRAEVLSRDSRTPVVVGSSCRVISGTWFSAYDGATWTNASDVDIDHVVALNEAWQSGAYAWTPQQRINFANDLTDSRTLMAVTDSVNQSKSDKDPTNWLPPLASYRCTYLANWVSVKVRWSLTMDEAEFATVRARLTECGDPGVSAAPALPSGSGASQSAPTTVPSAPSGGGQEVSGFVSPGAFCSPFGATGRSEKGVTYTCKPSDTEARNRWRR